jgi:hypothetical protein
MTAYMDRLGLMIAMATCLVALSVPAAGLAASDSTRARAATGREIRRCDIRAEEPLRDGHQYVWFSRIACHGSVTLHLVTKLQKRSGGRWHVVAKQDWGRVDVRHHDKFGTYKTCRHAGTFRSMGIMTKAPGRRRTFRLKSLCTVRDFDVRSGGALPFTPNRDLTGARLLGDGTHAAPRSDETSTLLRPCLLLGPGIVEAFL